MVVTVVVWDRGPRTWTMIMRAENQVKREQKRDDSDIKCSCLKQEGKYSNEERDGRGMMRIMLFCAGWGKEGLMELMG